jgi:hypothetical protein
MKSILVGLSLSLMLFSCTSEPQVKPVEVIKKGAARFANADVNGQWKLNYISSPNGIWFAQGDGCYGDTWIFLFPSYGSTSMVNATVTNRLGCFNGLSGSQFISDYNSNGNALETRTTGSSSSNYALYRSNDSANTIDFLSNYDASVGGGFRSYSVSFNSAKTVMYWNQTYPSIAYREIAWQRASGGPSIP